MSLRRAALLLVLAVVPTLAAAAEPSAAPAQHLGVRTCSGAPCHGNEAAVGRTVRQNEYATWSRHDAHSRAYRVLLDEPARRIATKLGLPQPAHESDLCLDCHADNVPEAERGKQFALEDGVGCEACHGGAERWLGPHISGSGDHARFVELGLRPTDEPLARGALCLSCHYGNERKFLRHRLYGAGHPRLRFELDTFTATQPAHYQVDADYAKRGKETAGAASTWAIGQALAARARVDALSDGRRKDGIWPEFTHFDCYACHHPLSEERWRPRPSMGVAARPGVARLDDSNLVLLAALLDTLDPALAARLRAETRALHGAYSAGTHDAARAVRELRETVDLALRSAEAWQPSAAPVRAVGLGVIDAGLSGAGRDYLTAEQVAMSVQALAQGLAELGAIDEAALRAIDAESTQLLAATRNPERYEPARAEAALRRMRQGFAATGG